MTTNSYRVNTANPTVTATAQIRINEWTLGLVTVADMANEVRSVRNQSQASIKIGDYDNYLRCVDVERGLLMPIMVAQRFIPCGVEVI